MFPAEIVVRDKADVAVTGGQLELRGDTGNTRDKFRLTCWLRYHAHKMATAQIEPIDILDGLFR